MTTANLSVDDNESVIQYTSTGETAFTFDFPILEASELRVSVDQVDQVNGTDYTVSGIGDEGGGTVTFMAATTAGELITIWLDMEIKRLTGFSAGASTILPSALNDELARSVRVEQMLRRDIKRSLRLTPDDPNSAQDMELPTSTSRAGRFLSFDASGKPTTAAVTGSEDTSLRADLASTDADKGNLLVAYIKRPEETTAGATIVNKYRPVGHILRYADNTPGTTDLAAAIQMAINVQSAAGGGAVLVPNEICAFESDILLKSNVALVGEGWGSHLRGNGAAIKVDGLTAGAHVTDWQLVGLRLSRIGTAGPVLHTTGDGTPGSNKGAIRFSIRDVYISASTGDGWLAENTYIGSWTGGFIRGCTGTGFKAQRDPTSSTVSVNALEISGVEIQSNGFGIDCEHLSGFKFDGGAIEGNAGGSFLRENCRNVTFDTVYWELNGSAAGDRDITIGDSGPSVSQVRFVNNVFWDGASAVKASAIEAVKVQGLVVDQCTFNAYETAAINNSGGGTAVTGRYSQCVVNTSGVVCATDTISFKSEISEAILTGSGTWDIPSLAAGASATATVTVTGAATTDFAQVAGSGGFNDVMLWAKVTSANTVTLLAFNAGSSTRDPGNTTYRVMVTPSGYFF